jgi:hypothetical protein
LSIRKNEIGHDSCESLRILLPQKTREEMYERQCKNHTREQLRNAVIFTTEDYPVPYMMTSFGKAEEISAEFKQHDIE